MAVWLGRILQIAALGFVAYLLHQHFGALKFDLRLLAAIAVAFLVAFPTQMLPMVGWWFLVRGGQNGIPFRPVYDTYARSALAKYLPGNIMHYAGRQAIGAQHGLRQMTMAAASVAEVLLVVAAGCGIGLAGILLSDSTVGLPAHLPALPILLPAAALTAVLAALAIGRLGFGLPAAYRLPPLPLPALGTALASSIGFMAGGALAFAAIGLIGTGAPDTVPVTVVIAAYGLGYVAGYVTPGSPGGLGVREAVLVMLLTPAMGPEMPLTMAIGLRLAWILAELGHFGAVVSMDLARQKPDRL